MNVEKSEISPHLACGDVENASTFITFMLFCCKIGFVAIHALLLQICFVAIYTLLCGEKFN